MTYVDLRDFLRAVERWGELKRLSEVDWDLEMGGIIAEFVSHIRQKIEPDPSLPKYILTEPGVGYYYQKIDLG